VPRPAKIAPSYTNFLSATSIAVGNYHACALVQDSNVNVYCWGYNVDGAVSHFAVQLCNMRNALRPCLVTCHASRLPLLATFATEIAHAILICHSRWVSAKGARAPDLRLLWRCLQDHSRSCGSPTPCLQPSVACLLPSHQATALP